jgi:AraC family transcriptional regulator, activator of mtrCDE
MMLDYFPRRVLVRVTENSAASAQPGTSAQVARLVSLIRSESAAAHLGGLAMLNALSTELSTVALRLASEANETPTGLLAFAGNPRLSPALTALFNEPGRTWSPPELARLCNMSPATFIRHFHQSLGRSASDLLTDIRMTVASNILSDRGVGQKASAGRWGAYGSPSSRKG